MKHLDDIVEDLQKEVLERDAMIDDMARELQDMKYKIDRAEF
jgi:hypothetical protein